MHNTSTIRGATAARCVELQNMASELAWEARFNRMRPVLTTRAERKRITRVYLKEAIAAQRQAAKVYDEMSWRLSRLIGVE